MTRGSGCSSGWRPIMSTSSTTSAGSRRSPVHYYRHEVERRQLTSAESMKQVYDAVRLRILQMIVATTPAGYRLDDAYLLIGEIDWQEGRQANALQAWRRMTGRAGEVYTRSSTEILAIVGGGRRTIEHPSRIDQVLRSRHGRWLIASYDRLHQFGFRFDTF